MHDFKAVKKFNKALPGNEPGFVCSCPSSFMWKFNPRSSNKYKSERILNNPETHFPERSFLIRNKKAYFFQGIESFVRMEFFKTLVLFCGDSDLFAGVNKVEIKIIFHRYTLHG